MEKRKTIDVIIGANMSRLRKKFNLTQIEICKVVGINTSTYKHYELGDRMVPISILQDLAKFYKVPTDYFFDDLPKLSNEDQVELCNNAFEVNKITQESLTINLKNPSKGLDELEEKTQARARLRIKTMRLENNKSQKDLAKYLSIDLSTYNKYEKGGRKISNEVVKKLAEYYNISISDIVD